jgi:hypothetical protein
MSYTTTISLDADENRVVWVVYVEDENGNVINTCPFRDKQDAEEYARSWNDELS